MTNTEIFAALIAAGMTKEGACGVLGNMAAESAMRPNNAQDSYGIDDVTYTVKTDYGQNDFVNDCIGYGLCQWTERSRKQKLLAYAKNLGVSISDPHMQVSFCVIEMQTDYPAAWKVVTTSHDLLECTQIVLNAYENPAVKNLGTRMEYAQQAYDYFVSGNCSEIQNSSPEEGKPPGGSADTAPDISGALAMLAAYLQTDEFAENFKKYIEGESK